MKNIWLHRISHHAEVSYPLLEKGYLSIGFSDFSEQDFISGICGENGWQVFEKYFDDMWGCRPRGRYSLFRFIAEMKKGDWVVIPRFWGEFSVYEIEEDTAKLACEIECPDFNDWSGKLVEQKADGLFNSEGTKIDLGFFRKVKPIAEKINRSDYADSSLTSRMKIRQTTAKITDLRANVESAIRNFNEKKPINIYSQIAENTKTQILETIKTQLNPDKFEKLVKWYFERIGATNVEIPTKNERDKDGDADVVATFDYLKLIVYAQVKFHKGTTSGWAVEQIKNYKEQKEAMDDGYSRVAWVVSSADDFDEKAQAIAENTLLINGTEFATMILKAGITNLENSF